MSLFIAVAIFAALVYTLHCVSQIGKRPPCMPPGPPTVPLFGNNLQMPPFHHHLKYAQWAETYGPLVTVMRGSNPTVLVSSAQAARDIFDKMGTITASRPPSYLMNDVAANGYSMGFAPNHDYWRLARRLFHSILNVGATKQYIPFQELETTKLLVDLLADPADFRRHIFRYSNSIGLLLTRGRRAPTPDDPEIKEVRENFDEYASLQLRGSLPDYFPVLRMFPDWVFPSIRRAREHCVKDAKIALKHFIPCKDSTNALPSFNRSLVEKQEKEGFDDIMGARMGLDLLTAATDTTSHTLINLIAALACFPEVQRKAHEEMDRVVGPDRIPNATDMAKLPYIRQVVQELHRWSSVTPFCLPHSSTKEITYDGYTIPAGSSLIINAYYMHNDPSVYDDPRAFKPERWEGKLQEAKEDSVGARSELFTFGAGRRICPGQHLAERNLFLTVSKVIWACDVSKKKTADGEEIPIDTENYSPGGIISIAPYAVDIKPRSDSRLNVAKREWKNGREEYLDETEQWKKVTPGIEELMRKVK